MAATAAAAKATLTRVVLNGERFGLVSVVSVVSVVSGVVTGVTGVVFGGE
jgi:hypothetical protein